MRNFFIEAQKHFGNKSVEGAEVGVLYADNAQDILSNWEHIKKLHLIDNYKKDNKGILQEAAIRNVKEFGDRVKWHVIDSVAASKKFYDESLDFVYLNADHTYKSVLRDIDAWYPKVKLGGVLGGHDYYHKPGDLYVKDAVDTWIDENDYELHVSNDE